MAVLVVAAHDGKTVRANVANAVTAATQMDTDVHVLVAGSGADEAAKSAAALQGVAKVLHAEDAAMPTGSPKISRRSSSGWRRPTAMS
jgi:electron transfer flavoprotein alpha subunit